MTPDEHVARRDLPFDTKLRLAYLEGFEAICRERYGRAPTDEELQLAFLPFPEWDRDCEDARHARVVPLGRHNPLDSAFVQEVQSNSGRPAGPTDRSAMIESDRASAGVLPTFVCELDPRGIAPPPR